MGVPDEEGNTRQGRITQLLARMHSATRDVLAAAADEARREGSSVLDTRHVLLGLATDRHRQDLLQVTMGQLRDASMVYQKSKEPAPVHVVWGDPSARPPLTFTDTVLSVFTHALASAQQQGQDYVPPQILMAALAEHAIDAHQVLTKATGGTGAMTRMAIAASAEVPKSKEEPPPDRLVRFLVELMSTVPLGDIERATRRSEVVSPDVASGWRAMADEYAKRLA